MSERFKVVTLCGSTKFKKEFEETQKKLTLDGNIVISVGLFGHSGDDEAWLNNKKMLYDMHKDKIDMADEIFVIDVDGYIGESTKNEIEYALSKEKPVKYYSGKLDINSFKIELFSTMKWLYERNTNNPEAILNTMKNAMFSKIDELYEYLTSNHQSSDISMSEWKDTGRVGYEGEDRYNLNSAIKCKVCGFQPTPTTNYFKDDIWHRRWTKEKYCARCGRFMVNNIISPLESVDENSEKNNK